MAAADLVMSCTGAPGAVITADMVRAAVARRDRPGAGLILLDLALPRDVEPAAAGCPAWPSSTWRRWPRGAGGGQAQVRDADIAAVRAILAEEFAAYLTAGRAATWPPRWSRCGPRPPAWWTPSWPGWPGRLDHLGPQAWQEIDRSMRRITDKLLHAPTVRVKELAGAPGADTLRSRAAGAV